MCCSHVYTSGMEYVVKNAPPSAPSLPGNPYTSTSRGELAALFHAIKWSRPSRTTTIFSTTSTMALSPIVGCPVSGPPLPHEPCKSYLRLRGYLGTSAAPTLARQMHCRTCSAPTTVRSLSTSNGGASGTRLSSGHSANLMTFPVEGFSLSWSMVVTLALGASPVAALPVVAWSAHRRICSVGAGTGHVVVVVVSFPLFRPNCNRRKV